MFHFDIHFVGEEWRNTKKWIEYEKQFAKINVKIIYFPYTKGISSTEICDRIRMINNIAN